MAKNDEKKNFNIKGMRIANARRLSDNVIAFSLLGNGLGLYDLRVVDSDSHGTFVAAPQQKAKDGKYYAVYAVYLSEEDQAKIATAVKAKLDEEKKPADADF